MHGVVVGLDVEGTAIVVSQLDADAMVFAGDRLESVPRVEEVALEARLRVELNLGQLRQQDGPRSETGALVDEWGFAGRDFILFVTAIAVVGVAIIVGEHGSLARS